RIISMKDGDRSVFQCPNNSVADTVCRNARYCAWVRETSRATRGYNAIQACICKSKRAETGFHRPEIKHTIEIGRRAKNSPPQQTWQILVNRTVRVRVKLSHVVSIHDVNVLILTCAYGQMSHGPIVVDHIRQYNRPAGPQV